MGKLQIGCTVFVVHGNHQGKKGKVVGKKGYTWLVISVDGGGEVILWPSGVAFLRDTAGKQFEEYLHGRSCRKYAFVNDESEVVYGELMDTSVKKKKTEVLKEDHDIISLTEQAEIAIQESFYYWVNTQLHIHLCDAY